MADSSSCTTYAFGVDAGDLHFIEANLDRLPTFARLFESKAPAPLKTTAGDLPGSVWPTFYTGTLPGEHGIYHHIQWHPESNRMRRVAEDWLYCEPFWYELARAGQRVCVFDVPMTFPTRLESGLEIINWGSHDQLGAYHANDKRAQQALRREFGLHPMGPEIPVNKTAQQLQLIQRNLIEGTEVKSRMTRHLMSQGPWDLFLMVFGECHRGGHILWRDPQTEDPMLPPDALVSVYEAVDAALGEILADIDLDRDRVILFSLHGMQTNYSQEHFIPKLMDRLNSSFRGDAERTTASEEEDGKSQASIMRTLREMVPARLQHAIAHAVPVWVRDWVVSRAVDGGHDWAKTPGLALLADLNGYLRFNVEGRETKGALAPSGPELENYRRWLVEGLESFETAEGQALVASVLESERHFPGERSGFLPDLVIRWTGADPTSLIRSDRFGEIQAELATGRGGNHRPEGFVWQNHAAAPSEPITHIRELPSLIIGT
ncbi:MAG: alkaline phosphatase family protein [Pseudomonadota bacterium]